VSKTVFVYLNKHLINCAVGWTNGGPAPGGNCEWGI